MFSIGNQCDFCSSLLNTALTKIGQQVLTLSFPKGISQDAAQKKRNYIAVPLDACTVFWFRVCFCAFTDALINGYSHPTIPLFLRIVPPNHLPLLLQVLYPVNLKSSQEGQSITWNERATDKVGP